MHFAADTVAAIFPHNGVSVLPGMVFDGKTDVSKMCARSNFSDACPHCLAGNLYTETPIILVTGDGYGAELLAFISGTVTGVT